MKKLILLSLIAIAGRSVAQQQKPVPSGVYHVADATLTKSADRESRKFAEGSTAELSYFRVHSSTQYKGAAAKPPHAQTDIEELIFVTEGTMKFTMGDKSQVLKKGSIVLVPPHTMQATENVGDGPLTYYVLMFRSNKPMDLERCAKAGGPVMLSSDSLKYVPSAKGGGIKYFQRPTAMNAELEMHITELKGRGPSHDPHTHVDTELILMLEGECEESINGKTYRGTAGDFFLMNSNELHGITNIQDKPCRYLAIRWK